MIDAYQIFRNVSEHSALALTNSSNIVLGSEGRYSIVQDDNDLANASGSSLDLDWHIDGFYHDMIPDVVALYCVDPGRADVTTDLADFLLALENLGPTTTAILERLTCNYIGKKGGTFSKPLISPGGISLAARAFISPHSDIGTLPTLREISSVILDFMDALEDAMVHSHTWTAGDLLIFNNRRYVHRRSNRTGRSDPQRKLYRMWFN